MKVLDKSDAMVEERMTGVSLLKCQPVNQQDSCVLPGIAHLKIVSHIAAQHGNPKCVLVAAINGANGQFELT
jgi:hypothetical protein